ncbi:hypothetical protein FS837_003275 [Tulasnella sp. UAMH 9824]|nr:hypothetical protein FS837_003275 [Tulasnella sp. UAMH 9824]
MLTHYLIRKLGDLEFQFGEFNIEADHLQEDPGEDHLPHQIRTPFTTTPKVIVFLSEIYAGNRRAKTFPGDVDPKGCTIHIQT